MGIAEYLSWKLAELYTKLFVRSVEDPIIIFTAIAIKEGNCCICGNKLRNPDVKAGHIAMIQIFKKATWDGPLATVNTRNGQYHNFAVSMICQQCEDVYTNIYADGFKTMLDSIKFAVELDRRRRKIVYHDVKELEDYPIIIER